MGVLGSDQHGYRPGARPVGAPADTFGPGNGSGGVDGPARCPALAHDRRRPEGHQADMPPSTARHRLRSKGLPAARTHVSLLG